MRFRSSEEGEAADRPDTENTQARGEARLNAIVAGLVELGHVEGQRIDFGDRFADGSVARLEPRTREFFALDPDLVMATAPAAARAMKAVAPALPIAGPEPNPIMPDLIHIFA